MSDIEELDQQMQERVLTAQQNELTEHHIYLGLSKIIKDVHNKEIIQQIAEDELDHHDFWRQFTRREVRPNRIKVFWYILLARVLGLTFSIKLMERGEEQAQDIYTRVSGVVPEARRIVADEDSHEDQLIDMIDEERLHYVGSVVLGLNDALVELTGTLAGLTLALQDTQLIGTAGLITGIAASLSMAASEYLSTGSEEGKQEPVRASLYTGSAYILTVVLLILPYFLLQSYWAALGVTVLIALLIIMTFTFYIGVAKDVPFKRRFVEMALLSFGVAALSFGIGFLVREFMGLDM